MSADDAAVVRMRRRVEHLVGETERRAAAVLHSKTKLVANDFALALELLFRDTLDGIDHPLRLDFEERDERLLRRGSQVLRDFLRRERVEIRGAELADLVPDFRLVTVASLEAQVLDEVRHAFLARRLGGGPDADEGGHIDRRFAVVFLEQDAKT